MGKGAHVRPRSVCEMHAFLNNWGHSTHAVFIRVRIFPAAPLPHANREGGDLPHPGVADAAGTGPEVRRTRHHIGTPFA